MSRSCRVEKYLEAYADGELAGRLRRRVESHLHRCEACARELDSILTSDRILMANRPPAPSEDQWKQFRLDLRRELDRADREATRPVRLPEARPVCATGQRRAFACAAAAAAVVFVVLAIGPMGLFPWKGFTAIAGNECIVDSIESMASGYTPMYFSSEDPEMTVIWVFSDEVDGGIRGEGPGAN
jgi:predicted anti-sigma-YlaC factor YlaD